MEWVFCTQRRPLWLTHPHAHLRTFYATLLMLLDAAQQKAAHLLKSRLAQLQALTILLYGEGFQGFSNLSDPYQEDILWLVADMVKDCGRQVRTVLWEKGETQ